MFEEKVDAREHVALRGFLRQRHTEFFADAVYFAILLATIVETSAGTGFWNSIKLKGFNFSYFNKIIISIYKPSLIL